MLLPVVSCVVASCDPYLDERLGGELPHLLFSQHRVIQLCHSVAMLGEQRAKCVLGVLCCFVGGLGTFLCIEASTSTGAGS